MTRVLAFMGVFALSIIGLLLLQPGAMERQGSAGSLDVTRTGTDTMLSTRLDSTSSVAPAVAQAPAPTPAALSQLAAVQKLQNATQASLSKRAMVPAAGDMRAMTSDVLASLRGSPNGAAATGQSRLAALVSRSIGETGGPGTDAFKDALQREALYGTEKYDKLAMVGAERDTADVKSRWIENARRKSKAMSDATAFMSSGTQTTPGFDDTVHIVKRGDSLMKLSIRYYGRTIDYALIYEANRDVLESPDKIRVGQKLKIPPVKNV